MQIALKSTLTPKETPLGRPQGRKSVVPRKVLDRELELPVAVLVEGRLDLNLLSLSCARNEPTGILDEQRI